MDDINETKTAESQDFQTAQAPLTTTLACSSTSASPIEQQQRIVAIDVLRGFALLGILILNIQSFALPSAAFMNPSVFGDFSGVNYGVWWASHVLGDQKFMTIFSMLFGAGIVMMTQRSEKTSGGSASIHYRRMGWLILFGLLHAHLLWYGDILYSYGMCGLLVWLARKWPAPVLLSLGMLLITIGFSINLLTGWSMNYWPQELLAEFQQEWQPTAEMLQAEIDAYRGSWMEQAPHRSSAALGFQTLIFFVWTFWRVTGLMLIGMALYRWSYFSASWPRASYLALALTCLIIGISLSAYGVHWNESRNWSVKASFFIGSQWNYWGSFFSAVGLASGVLFLCNTSLMRYLGPLAAVGRMALTNYLMQTLLCTTLFYGFGLGLFASLDRMQLLGVVLVVWSIQMVVSPIWLARYRFGPMEWIWRSLTYWKAQPMTAKE